MSVIRYGAVSEEEVAIALRGSSISIPTHISEMIREDVPVYDAFQDAVVEASR